MNFVTPGRRLGAAESMAGVLERMAAVDARLPGQDGVAHFNRLYRVVTEAVRDEVRAGLFADAHALERLDVVFANLYFVAVDRAEQGADVPAAWAPLFSLRHRRHRVALQFALAGMSAHINHDLPLAVLQTARELGFAPTTDTVEHRDFELVNDLLARTEGQIKESFLRGLAERLDERCGNVDDTLCMDAVRVARSAAWHHAHTLWTLSGDPRLHDDYLRLLSGSVSILDRALLL